MNNKHNKDLIPFARKLRREMTRQERHLWYDFLSKYPIRFQRQKILGDYIADFYCAEASLVIELDGSQHYEKTAMVKDRIRTEYIEQYGIMVIRIPNNEIDRNFKLITDYIDQTVGQRINPENG